MEKASQTDARQDRPAAEWEPLYSRIDVQWSQEIGTSGVEIEPRHIGALTIMKGSATALRVERGGADVRRERYDNVSVSLLLNGVARVESNGRAATYESGDLVLIDEASAYTLHSTETEFLAVVVPRPMLLSRVAGLRTDYVNGWRADGLLPVALAGFLRTLVHHLPAGRRSDEPHLEAALVTLVAGTIASARTPSPHASSRDGLRDTVSAFIEDNLTLDELSADVVSAALGISRSSLYRAFADSAGIANFIQQARLDAIARLLSEPGENRSVAELAATYGFVSTTHFGRAFRKRYGETPGRFRRLRR